MSKNQGRDAFPGGTASEFYPGMTLRQWYKGQALAGIMANPRLGEFKEGELNLLVSITADAMIAEDEESFK